MSQVPNNITELIASLEGLGKNNLNNEFELFGTCREVFEKLKRLSDFDPGDLKKTIKTLKDLPPEIKELKIEELENREKKLESRALNKLDLKQLLEDYEKAQNEKEKEKIENDFYLITGRKNVVQFIRIQNEIALKNQGGLKQLNPEIKERIIEELTINRLDESEKLYKIIEKNSAEKEIDVRALKKELNKNGYKKNEVEKIIQKTEEIKTEIKKQVIETRAEKEHPINPEVKEKIIEELALYSQDKDEIVIEIVEKASLKNNQEFKEKDLKKELKKRIKDPERVEYLIQKVEEIRTEIVIEEKAAEIAKITYEKLLERKLPISKEVEAKIKNEILIAWRDGDEIKIPSELTQINEAGVVIKETEKAASIFKNENMRAIVNYRGLELGREISQSLRKNGVQDESLIREYVATVNELTNNPETAREEINTSEVVTAIRQSHGADYQYKIQPERAEEEASFVAKNVVMAPKKFNRLIQSYNNLREKIGAEKLPKLREIRVVEKMTAMFKESPKLLKLMNGAQKMVGVWEKVNSFPGNLLPKFGVQKAGLKILEKIGGQTAIELIKNSAAIIAKEGTVGGIKSIVLGIMGKGAVVAGGSAGASTGVAAMVAAFQALPVVGQVVAVVAIAVTAVVAIVKPIITGVKKIISKITGIDANGVKHFLSETIGLGKVVGSVGQFIFDVGTFLIGIPVLLGLINFAAIITPVVIFFFLGTFTYSLFSENLLSSLVPPKAIQGEYCFIQNSSNPDGLINCNQGAPENSFAGINKISFVDLANRWTSGKNYSDECYNDTVNRALCSGINPAFALWAWVHESGASNYSIKDVEDFGIHGQPSAPPKNYSAQINYFLKLDPASACIDDPRIGGDYWLAFATNYLNGSCDPDEKNPISGNTGRGYLEEMQKTWGWVSSLPMPNDIHVPKAGQNCNESGEGSNPPITREYTDSEGNQWVCYWTINIPGPIIPGQGGTGGAVTQCPFGGFSHNGIWAMDFAVPNGTPIYSTFPGIARVGEGNGYGVYVDIQSNINGDDFFIRYAHMPPGGNMVSTGQSVQAGQQIGISDNNGFSTGPHLHYEVVGANISWDNAGPYFGMTQEEFNSACR